MRFWWVNHKQTVRHEIAGGYLWSPKRKSDGARNQFYDNMVIAAPGDVVLSFAHGEVGHVGVVTGQVIDEAKPVSFGSTGEYWSNDGWWLPVDWTRLPDPFVPKKHIERIRRWLPDSHSPIRPASGEGNQGAYLAEIPADLFYHVISQAQAPDWAEHITANPEADDLGLEYVAESHAEYGDFLGPSTKQQIIQARRGQGLFRFRVSQLEPACRVTKIVTPNLLIASHMKPWKSCVSTQERLDGANGLLLTPDVDKLFDKGLIGFTDTGVILRSKWLKQEDARRLGLEEALVREVGPFSPRQRPYLDYHREEVFGREPN